ncbi:MAG: hypothetical protein ACK4UJ_00790 [Leptonema sp. (in: bacteria)]
MNKNFRFKNLAIANLTNLLVLIIAVVNLLDIFFGTSYPQFQIQMLFTRDWWQIFLFPFRITTNVLSLAIFLYIFWIFGTQLEAELSTVKYNLFIFSGYFFILIGTYFYPIDAYFVYLSVFFAVAFLYPNMEILLFFILPIKMKWIGLLTAVFLIFNSIYLSFVMRSFFPILGPIFGILNFLIFIVFPYIKNRTPKLHQIQYKLKSQKRAIHKCTVCGITELEDPYMDFRYCVHCKDHEYCSKHLQDHEHIQ